MFSLVNTRNAGLGPISTCCKLLNRKRKQPRCLQAAHIWANQERGAALMRAGGQRREDELSEIRSPQLTGTYGQLNDEGAELAGLKR